MPGARRLSVFGVVVALATAPACAHPSATAVAQSLVRQHREDEAVATLQRRLQAHPDDVAARKLLVKLQGLSGDLTGARASVAELVRWLPPGDPSPFIELGHAFELAHRYDEALEAYDEAAS